MIFNIPKPKPKESRPPEPTFYDKPENMPSLNPFNGWLKKNWFFAVICIGVLLMLVLSVSSPKTRAKGSGVIGNDEKRETVSREAVEQSIEQASVNKKNTLKPISKNLEQKTKRNYSTPIEAFVYQEDKPASGSARVRSNAKSELMGIPSGTRIPALLSNRIFSFNVAAPVIAVLGHDFKWKDKVVIPKGAKFLGEASIVKSIDRINVNFDTLVFPDGRELRIRAMALSADGSGGIKGKVKKHRDIKALKAVGEALLGGVSLFAGGVRRDPFSMEDQLRLNLTQNLTSQAAQDLRSVRVDQSITAEAYTPIDVMILEKI